MKFQTHETYYYVEYPKTKYWNNYTEMVIDNLIYAHGKLGKIFTIRKYLI
jgi:hypothetical protein